uniref:Uncharacterized protein n=1 Tax=Brassica oleracea TaxID=3712 RepID=A0A3P6G5I7_BRAOL|nr:unnamed protein product [Brassica oleracea]
MRFLLFFRFPLFSGALLSYLKRVVLKSGFSENRELGFWRSSRSQRICRRRSR